MPVKIAEGREPVPPAAGIGAAVDRDALDEGAQRDALREGRDQRAAEEGPVPQQLAALGPEAEFEGNAAKDQPSSMAMIGA